jgi:hypothetical protein
MRREIHAKYFYQNLYCSIATRNYKELITELCCVGVMYSGE